MEYAIYLTREEATSLLHFPDGQEADQELVVQLRHTIFWMKQMAGTLEDPRIIYADEEGILTDLDMPACPHIHQDINDRSLAYCKDCGEELGR